jgi:hypothetical protein
LHDDSALVLLDDSIASLSGVGYVADGR